LASKDAVQEAAHAILFAYAGFESVSVKENKCGIEGPQRPLLNTLAGVFAGFTADKFISELSDGEILNRTRTDFEELESILRERVSDSTAHAAIVKAARERSHSLVMRFKAEILELAGLLDKRGAVSADEFESLEYVQKVRALGISENTGAASPQEVTKQSGCPECGSHKVTYDPGKNMLVCGFCRHTWKP
jgi:hypothetical protein